MSEMSAAEAATVARFDAAEPAPESWRGDDGLRADWDGPLRTALVQAVEEHADMWGADATPQGYADAVLALPEVAALRAKAAAADRVLRLVEDAAEMNDETVRSLRRPTDIKARHEGLRDAYRDAANHLRRALDGPQC